MRLGEYFEIGKRMKQARTNAGINQRDMSSRLSLTNSSYSNYENGYSEPREFIERKPHDDSERCSKRIRSI